MPIDAVDKQDLLVVYLLAKCHKSDVFCRFYLGSHCTDIPYFFNPLFFLETLCKSVSDMG